MYSTDRTMNLLLTGPTALQDYCNSNALQRLLRKEMDFDGVAALVHAAPGIGQRLERVCRRFGGLLPAAPAPVPVPVQASGPAAAPANSELCMHQLDPFDKVRAALGQWLLFAQFCTAAERLLFCDPACAKLAADMGTSVPRGCRVSVEEYKTWIDGLETALNTELNTRIARSAPKRQLTAVPSQADSRDADVTCDSVAGADLKRRKVVEVSNHDAPEGEDGAGPDAGQ